MTTEKTLELQEIALKSFFSLGCKDFARVDFLEDQNGKHYLMEINTIPGFTSHSLVPMAAKAIGIDFDELTLQILAMAGLQK